MIPDLPIGDLGDIQAPPRWRNTALVTMAFLTALLVGAVLTVRLEHIVRARGTLSVTDTSVVEARVAPAESGRLHQGQVAWITFDGIEPSHRLRGTLTDIALAPGSEAWIRVVLPLGDGGAELRRVRAAGGEVLATVAIVTESETLGRRVIQVLRAR